MKKNLMKVMSVLLAISMLLPLSVVASAEEITDDTTIITQVTDEASDSFVYDGNEVVATLSVCSCVYFFPVVGHTWIYVDNLTGRDQQVGLYTVPANQGVSVGSFSFSVSDGWGLYYNLEAYRENRDNNSDDHWTITRELTADELKELSDSLIEYPNFWSFYFNCAFFAFSIWNSAAGSLFIPLVIPAISQFEIILGGGDKGELEMYYPTRDQIFRQRGSGDKAYLDPVSDKTFNG